MTTITDVKKLAVKDADFRRSLFSNPEDTLRRRRLTLSDRDLSTLKRDINNLTSSKSIREIETLFRDNPLGW